MTSFSSVFGALFFASLAVACSSASDDELGTVDEALTSDANFSVGDRLQTTARLNLRAGPSRSEEVLTIMPRGAAVTVTATSARGVANPTGDFFHVSYAGQSGWAHGGYLVRGVAPGAGDAGAQVDPGPASAANAAAVRCMAKIAQAARSVDGEGSGGMCYHGVKEHIGSALGIGFEGVQNMVGDGYQMHAWDFARWINENPGGRAAASGLARSSVSLDALPVGAIIVWRPGQCGYSEESGHIEVNIGGGRACSDFCGRIKTSCGAPTVVLYTKGC